MPIFHLATAADWAAAQQVGRYTTSTRGRSLAEEGFVHAARADQWQGVRERYYADVTEPLVLLVVDPERLTAPVVDEAGPDGVETFPHVYGAIDVAAVTRVIALDATPAPEPVPSSPPPAASTAPPTSPVPRQATPQRSFLSLYLEEMAVRAGVGFAVIVLAVVPGLLLVALVGDVAGLVTILVLLVLGTVVAAWLLRRRSARHVAETAARSAGAARADSEA